MQQKQTVGAMCTWSDEMLVLVDNTTTITTTSLDENNTSNKTSSGDQIIKLSKNNHKEAEKRRRQRINSHLHTLRTLLPCNSKTDKASVLTKVVNRVKELEQQSSHMMQLQSSSSSPWDCDDIMVVTCNDYDNLSHQNLVIKASFCCQDRSDLIPDLVQTLKSLRLRPLRAEMLTFGGRIRNFLIVSAHKDGVDKEVVELLRDALRSLVQRSDLKLNRQLPINYFCINS